MDEPKKKVRYVEADVLTEAKRRINHIIDTFDKIFVCFSGGKDSLAVLNLVEEVYRERGITDKINVIFRDEEVIPDDVIAFVQEKVRDPRYTFYYYAVQLASEKFILGKTCQYVQWDINRKWLRPKPDFAITDPLNRVFNQHTMDAFIAEGHKGRLAFINGIRTDESLVRYRSVVNKRNECYIAASSVPNVKLCKPIYDWSQTDVFKYFHDRGIRYCSIYDMQLWNGQAFRVATPLHAESAKRFDQLRTLYPMFYQQLVELFPEMLVQERYWNEFDRHAVIHRYPKGWNGIIQYIREEIDDPVSQKLAVKRVVDAKTFRENNIRLRGGDRNFGGYPILYVFKCIVAGQFERTIQPCKTPSAADIEYESEAGHGSLP